MCYLAYDSKKVYQVRWYIVYRVFFRRIYFLIFFLLTFLWLEALPKHNKVFTLTLF